MNDWKLWLDDQIHDLDTPERHPPKGYIGAASTKDAIWLVESLGLPKFMSLDHDLSGEDTSMEFLKWLSANFETPPDYRVHSANPVGTKNIISYMESWKKSITL